MNRSAIYSITVGLLLILLIRTTPVWEREIGGLWNVLFFLIICILLILLFVRLTKELIKILRDRKNLSGRKLLPTVIIILVLLDLHFNPFNIDLLSYYGETTFRACYEGTQNQATFELKGKDRFELHSTGVFFQDHYYMGNYKKRGDTLFLSYETDKPNRVRERMLMDDNAKTLVTIKSESDSLEVTIPFYYGYCQGLN